MGAGIGDNKRANQTSDQQQHNLEKARGDQESLGLINKLQSDLLADMEKLQTIATEHHTVAQLWEQRGDTQMAQKALALEQQALALLDRLARVDGMSENEAQVLLDEMKNLLK